MRCGPDTSPTTTPDESRSSQTLSAWSAGGVSDDLEGHHNKKERLNMESLTLTAEMAAHYRPSTDEKTREARLRRKAASCDLRLVKSRARDPDRLDHGLYGLIIGGIGGMVNPATVTGQICSWSLDDVEQYLSA
jgi:hypothetical protein